MTRLLPVGRGAVTAIGRFDTSYLDSENSDFREQIWSPGQICSRESLEPPLALLRARG